MNIPRPLVRRLLLVGTLGVTLLASPVFADLVLLSADQSAGISGTVGDDDEFFSDGSGDATSDFGPFDFAGGVRVSQPQGSVDGFVSVASVVSANFIAMSASADANVSAGQGEFDFASGGGHASLSAWFQTPSLTGLDLVYSGGGYPAYVEPYFILQQINGPVLATYGSGDVQELILLPAGQYVISAGISAGASTSFPGDAGSAFGGLNLTIQVITLPEASSITLAAIGLALLGLAHLRRH